MSGTSATKWTRLRRCSLAVLARRARLDPAVFYRRVLGLELQPFQLRWIELQRRRRRTLVLAPRGHGKSTTCTVGYALWCMACNVQVRILVVSATAFQAQTFLRQVRGIVESNRHLRRLFSLEPATPWTSSQITVARPGRLKEPTLTAQGVGGSIIGRHYDVIIGDDLVDRDAAATERSRRDLHEWFGSVLVPCLEPGGSIHLVGTRWHEKDLYAELMDQGHLLHPDTPTTDQS